MDNTYYCHVETTLVVTSLKTHCQNMGSDLQLPAETLFNVRKENKKKAVSLSLSAYASCHPIIRMYGTVKKKKRAPYIPNLSTMWRQALCPHYSQ
jgi:hypothetical protein